MRLLVLGGTRFLGRAVVETALADGWEVTTLTRGISGLPPSEVDARIGDRSTPEGLATLGEDEWDVCVDTSGFVPRDVWRGARALVGRVGHYVFVSTVNVYPDWPDKPIVLDSPVHDCAPDAGPDDGDAAGLAALEETVRSHERARDEPPGPDDGDYGMLKAGCERAVDESFPGAATHNRSGLQIGPAEDTDRLSWWLARIARGGDVLAPGRPGQEIALIDVRDMAAWMLHCGRARIAGPYVVTAPMGTQTFGELLRTCREVTGSNARLRWLDDEALQAAGVEPWTELPLWLPTELAAYAWNLPVAAALGSGLRIRPLVESVADTWAWMDRYPAPPARDGRPAHGIDPERERKILTTAG